MKKLYLVLSGRHKAASGEILRELLPWLKSQARIVGLDSKGTTDLSRVRADLLMVFGGDGAMLSVARRLRGNPLPVLGVNLGQLGFMAEVYPHEVRQVLPLLLRGQYILSPRMMLRAVVQGRRRREFLALNDAVILRRPHSAMVTQDIFVAGEFVARYKADGLIVATATGSTAYSLSAGGPILSERLKALIIVPVCPHTLANRPIVVSGTEAVEVTSETRNGEPLELVLDGQVSLDLPSEGRVRIEKAAREFNLVTLGRKGRYEIIRDKLHWAGWVKENQ